MDLTSNDSQKYRKFIISTWYLCLERKIIFIPNPTNEIKCCFCFSTKFHYSQMLVIEQPTAVDLCATLRRARAHDANDVIPPFANPPSGSRVICFL